MASQVNTSLIASFSMCQNNSCTSVTISNTSGIYSVDNIGGLGSPSIVFSDIDVCTLGVTFPDGTTTTLDLLALSLGQFPEFDFEITASMLGLSGKLPDGVWLFTLTYSGDGIDDLRIDWSSSTSSYFFFACQASCCLNKLLASIQPDECMSCSDDLLKKVIKGFTFLDSAHNATSCGSIKRATKLLASANFICNSKSCTNC